MNLVEIWQKAQDPIKSSVGTTSYDTWFASLNPVSKTPDTLLLQAPDEFFKNWIVEHYGATIARCLNGEAGREVLVEFEVNSTLLSQGTQQKLTTFEKSFESRFPNFDWLGRITHSPPRRAR